MIHLFLIDNELIPTLDYPDRYLRPFQNIVPNTDLNGVCLLVEFGEPKYFKMTYARIQNTTEAHKDHVYIVARFDHTKFPQMEGYVERRVMPELEKTLDEIEEIFYLDLDDQFEEYDEERGLGLTLYVYNGDTDGINAAVSGWMRNNMIGGVDDGPFT